MCTNRHIYDSLLWDTPMWPATAATKQFLNTKVRHRRSEFVIQWYYILLIIIVHWLSTPKVRMVAGLTIEGQTILERRTRCLDRNLPPLCMQVIRLIKDTSRCLEFSCYPSAIYKRRRPITATPCGSYYQLVLGQLPRNHSSTHEFVTPQYNN